MKATLFVLAGLVLVVPIVQGAGLLDLSAPGHASGLRAVHEDRGGFLDLMGDHGPPRAFGNPSTNPRRLGDAAAGYDFGFTCPEVQATATAALGCPLYVQDEEDIMTQPVMVIDPRDPNMIAFHALHGGYGTHPPVGADQPPSDMARDDVLHQPHTVFRTQDGAASWNDDRYYSPYKGFSEGQVFPTSEYDQVYGIDNAMTMDGTRSIVVGSLYAYRDDGEPDFHNVVFLWKGKPINHPFETGAGGTPLFPEAATNHIDNLHLAYAKESNRLVVVWRESIADATQAVPATGPASWIQFATSEGGANGNWTKSSKTSAVGPCADISTPVALNGLVYVACLPDVGYVAPAGFEPRFFQIYAFDPVHGTTAHMVQVAATSGHPVLARLAGDEMVLVTAGVQGEKPFVILAIGEPTTARWTKMISVGDRIRNVNVTNGGSAPVVAARVTAVGMAPESHYIHFIYQEKYDRSGGQASLATTYGAPEIYKAMGALSPKGAWAAGLDLKVGDVQTRMHFDPQYQGVGDGVFWDAHDSFVMFQDKTGKAREFVAFGDYGYARVAELIEQGAPPVGIGVAPAPPAVPAANPGLDPATAGAIAGALSGALSLRILAARKKSKVEAPSL